MKEVIGIFEDLNTLWSDFIVNHEKFVGGNKSAGARARKAIGTMKKLITSYRQASSAAQKNLKGK